MSILLFSFALLLSSCGLAKKLTSDNAEDENGLRFNLQSDGTYSVAVGKNNNYKKIEIPATYEGKPVTSISSYGIFDGSYKDDNDVVEEIYISEGVTKINENAFYGFLNLKKINVPSSVTFIDEDAFLNCYSLEEIHISDMASWCSISFANHSANPLYWSEGNLYLDDKLVTALDIPDNVTEIKSYAFIGNQTLTDITIPESVTYIGNRAFEYCRGLTNVTIGNGVTSIGDEAFYFCTSLSSVTIGNNVTSIGNLAFNSCKSLTSVTIGNSVKSIGNEAFPSLHKLVEIYNLSDLTITAGSKDNGEIGLYALNVYTSLDTPSKQWVSDDGYVFYEDGNTCYLLGYVGNDTELTLPESCHGKNYAIYQHAFYENEQVTKITIPDSVTYTGTHAFAYCYNLASVSFGNSVETIGSFTFLCCASLASVVIPDSVAFIDDGAFSDCSNLTSVSIPDSIKVIDDSAFNHCPIEYNEYDNAYYLGNAKNPYVALIEVKSNHITSCKIHNDTKIICDRVFVNCRNLTSLALPNGLTSIGEYAFSNCNTLKSIVIPASLQNIGEDIFKWCDSLTAVYFTGSSDEWSSLLSDNGYSFDSATVYYYSENAPAGAGSFWHFVDGVATAW